MPIRLTVLSPLFTTKIGSSPPVPPTNAIAVGARPTGIVAATLSFAALRTVTVLSPLFVTYTCVGVPPDESKAIAEGERPTGIVLTTLPEASMTVTSFVPLSAT